MKDWWPARPPVTAVRSRSLRQTCRRVEGTNTYLPTAAGQRVAIFYTKVHSRLLRPLLAANTPPAPVELRQALHTIDRHVHSYIDDA